LLRRVLKIFLSRAPTNGGQYHWVAQFSPPRFSAFLSWTTGWIEVLGWQAVLSSVLFLGGTMIQGLLVLNYSDTYVWHRWHGSCLYWAIGILCAAVNAFAIRIFPVMEVVVLVGHIVFYFLILIPLVVLAPKSSATFVFTTFQNSSGWDSDFVAWCIGLASGAFVLTGFDGAVHMSQFTRPLRTL
jgi:choline transport protein